MKATLEDLEKEAWLRMRNQGILKWTTKEGKEIPINEMSDTHLVNTINMLKEQNVLQDLSCEYEVYLEGLD